MNSFWSILHYKYQYHAQVSTHYKSSLAQMFKLNPDSFYLTLLYGSLNVNYSACMSKILELDERYASINTPYIYMHLNLFLISI